MLVHKCVCCFGFALALCASVKAQSQGEMNIISLEDFRKVDNELKYLIAKVAADLDEEGKKKFLESERVWELYRDAQAAFQEDLDARGGTMGPTIYNEAKVEMTQARIDQIKKSTSTK